MDNLGARASFARVYDLVFVEIVSGRYRPGERIALKELSERLRVSTTPLREILSRLVGRGLVEQRRSEGYYLARLDARDIADLYALHHVCVERALVASPPLLGPSEETYPDAWLLFDELTQNVGNVILFDIRRTLDDRLRPVRRLEAALIDDFASEAVALIRSLSDLDTARVAIRSFHQRRDALASEFAIRLARQ